MSTNSTDYHGKKPGDHSTVAIHTTRLHCVRLKDITKDDFKLKADFGNKIIITFNEEHQFHSKDNLTAFIYTLHLNGEIDNNKQLCIINKDGFKPIDKYHLILSRPRPVTVYPKMYHQEKVNQEHKLAENFENPDDYFLFDIQFSKEMMLEPPGINTNCFEDLCLFTYYLVDKQMYHMFDRLAHQFQVNLVEDNRHFDKKNYHEFFKMCTSYMDNILPTLETHIVTLKIIVRMIGLLPITKTNFDRFNEHANYFATQVLRYIRPQFNNLFESVNEPEQVLFKSGLATLLCIELLYSTDHNSNDNKLIFLCQISDVKQRQIIAHEILLQLYEFNEPIYANSTWTDLFTIVDPNMIKLQDVYIFDSFETYIMFITKVSPVYPDSNHFYSKITKQLKDLIYFKNLRIDIESIRFLIQFTQRQPTCDDENTKQLLDEIRRLIKVDDPLKYSIEAYFDSLDINVENLENIGYILGLKSKCTILDRIKKDDVLRKSLKKNNSHEYCIKWFKCFFANDGHNHKKYQELLEGWTKYFKNDYSKFKKVLTVIDELIGAFKGSIGNEWLCSYFIDHIIHLCSTQNDLYSVIADGLFHVQNEHFRRQFKIMFDNKYTSPQQQNLFKELENDHGLFSKLIDLDEKENAQSMLVRDLIEVMFRKIEIKREDLIHDAFNEPTESTSTYRVLFIDSLKRSPLYIKTIEQLIPIWEEWEKDGFYSREIKTWTKLNDQQQQVVCQIWNTIGGKTRETIRFEQLIDKTKQQMEIIMKIIENIKLYINNYCQEACDKTVYHNLVENMEKQLNEKKVLSISVPKKIDKIKLSADRLNSAFSSQVWRNFYNELKSNALRDEQEITCFMILKQGTEILDQFTHRLADLCTEIDQPLLPQLEQLFPNKNYIDHELSVLKTLLDNNISLYLAKLLEYWKTREHINRVCNEFINLINQYNAPVTEKISVLKNMLDIGNETSVEICSKAYQAYCVHYSKVYSEPMLKLIAQWSSSKELLEFLNSLEATDVDDLLEVVNDWDETLINTKTVLDFVLLKRFLHQANTMIESARAEKPLELNDIVVCFEKVWEEIEFKNILTNFESCSKCLLSIKRICMGSANKELSKRRRILDIIKNSQFCFCVHQLREAVSGIGYQFDVHIMNNNWEPISFGDLSALRDRARLIQYASSNSRNLQNDTDDNIQQLRLFVIFVETIEVILESLTSLNAAGYPVVKQYSMSRRKFTCNDGHYNELDRFKSDLEAQLEDWEKQLCTMYERCIDLTYFSYQQLWMVENSLYKQTVTASNDPGYHLLKYIGIDPHQIRLDILPPLSKEPNGRLRNITQILNTQRPSRNFSRQEDGRISKKVFLIETSNKGILRAIYSLFRRKNIPVVANQLFYCTKDTNWMEIKAFIYRCFYSQTLHQLIQPELLSLIIQDKFAQLLNQLIEQNPKHIFLLGIITTIPISQLHIVNGLRAHHIMQTIHDQEMLSEEALANIIRSSINDNCTLVTSDIAGLGKSTYIRNEIRQRDKIRVKFPITGNANIDALVERLCDKEIQLALSRIGIHIDIGPVENVQQLNEFLYSLVLFRCFRLGQVPVHIPIDIPIYIELDSSAYLLNLKKELVILQYLKTTHINRIDWNELESNSSTVQLVVNYLQAIEDETINSKDICEETISTLGESICIRLLQKHFLHKKNTEFISWTQLSIFIAVYYKLFSDFSKCSYLLVDPYYRSTLRLDILKGLLNSSDQFTSLSVGKVRRNQRSINDDEPIFLFNEAIIRWGDTKPFTVIFTATCNPLFVYKTVTDIPRSLIDAYRYYFRVINTKPMNRAVPSRSIFTLFKFSSTNDVAQAGTSPVKSAEEQLREFLIDHNTMTHEQFFLRLTELSTKYILKKSICKKCFRQYEYNSQQCTICSMENTLVRPDSWNSTGIEAFQKIIAEKLQSEYVLTADNYIKMLLIYLRVQSNLPVLIMGETGCGKTALIQFLCQKLLNDEMAIFRIHAGVTNEKIFETMREFVRKADNCSKQDPNKRLWVFFDEFNTTPNIGLLKEIVCERTLLGKTLPKNMVFLGACNPQRRKNSKEEFDDTIGIKKHYTQILRHVQTINPLSLYSVVPIPETMLEYVWDYGYLDEATEQSYIKTILNACEQLTTNQIWFKCIVKSISISQKYFRKHEDVSSVSLRDVNRFCRFYNWFYKRIIPNDDQPIHNLNLINNVERASLIALFLCYYFRLNSPSKRKDYMDIIEELIGQSKPSIPRHFLYVMLQTEKMALVNRMDLPKGTAKNRALTDNIFVLFTCILNRIPVILCGKPGSSKTSAVQIVISNLKGKQSNDLFFQTLPELTTVSYQGSQNCTSESIIKVFARADKYIEAKTDIDLLPVIVFDEIGLAELSPHNPLKVLHSELETETCRHGFVGLSNWRLDASKMNRALYLSCPDPDLDDLKITALTLSNSMLSENTQINPLDDSIIESLANAYMAMSDHLRQSRKNQYYFGLRDYYALIKGIVYDRIDQNKEQDLYKLIRYHLSINFDGTADDSNVMWSKFCEYLRRNDLIDRYLSPTFDQLINQSISSRTGRFLMLIGDSESAFDYIQRYIITKDPSLQTRTLIGSTLTGDFLSNTTYTEQYNTRVLMDIILFAETNVTLFLRGLGHLYDNLYDLFNQNFAVSAKKKFCRIALGSLYHPRCVIHDSFYCVVFVKKQDLDKYDPPFLNRFEKHFINIDALIYDHQKIAMSKLDRWINETLSIKPGENFPCSKHIFIEYNDNYIFNLVTDAFDHLDNHDTLNAIEYCQDQMIHTSSFDLPLLLSLKSNHFIQRYYQIHADLSFSSFINQQLEKKTISKLLIYTYTQIYDDIDYHGIKNSKQWIEEVKLRYFKTELELRQKIKMHYQTKSSRLLIIRIDYHEEYEHIPMLKHLLINEQTPDETHGVCLIFHLQRNRLNQISTSVFFNNWSRVMIDDLGEHRMIPQDILLQPSYRDLIIHRKFLSSEQIFNEHVHRCFMKFRYQVSNKHFEAKINQRLEGILQQLTSPTIENADNHPSLRSLIHTQIIENLPSDSQSNDWRRDLLTNEIIIGSCRSYNDALAKIISFFLDNYLSLLLAHLEKHSLIDSYIFLLHSSGEKLYSLWLDCWKMTMQTIDRSALNRDNIEIPLVFDLHLPCATIEYEIIRQIRETVAQTDEDNSLDSAWKQLMNLSVYGHSINTILNDSDLFQNYYHDQLTLAKNEANVYEISTSFIQHLLTSKIPGTVKDHMKHLLIDYEELFIIMQLFEISLPFIGEEDYVLDILNQQFTQEKTTQDLYSLVFEDKNFYHIPPKSKDRFKFESQGNPFIEISLMNLIELLMSPTVINKINDIEQLIITYGLFSQNMIKLSRHNHYEISNLEKFHSLLRLASATLVSNEKALTVFKQVYRYSDFCGSFNTLDQIRDFISYLNKVINEQQSIADQRILIKLETELLRNWLIGNSDKCGDIVKFISDDKKDLWKYTGKIFTTIDKSLNLSSSDEYREIDQCLCELNDSTRKIELLMTTRIYMNLILDENCQPRITKESDHQITSILKDNFIRFKENIEDQNYAHGLKLINSIAWLRYYLQYYVYALINDIRDNIMEDINKTFIDNRFPFVSTLELCIIKQFCQVDNITFHDVRQKFANRIDSWIDMFITRPVNPPRTLHARYDVILPTPLFACRDEFIRVDSILSARPTNDKLLELIKECSTKQETAYCFIIWFIHHYSRFYMRNISPDNQWIHLIKDTLQKELTNCFESIGYQLILSLCTNFNEKSYFQLQPFTSEEFLHQRLLVLNIIAFLISFKSIKGVSLFGFLLYDGNHQTPENYSKHFKNFDSLSGVAAANDPALIQMIHIRTQIQNQTTNESNHHIIRCSSNCMWMFYFKDLNEQKQCPLCKTKFNGDLQPPHIRMDINETLQFIADYIEHFNENHLTQPISYHFIHLLTQAIFLFLNDLGFIPNSSIGHAAYFQDRFETHYALFRKRLFNVDQCYVWIYKLINHMVHNDFVVRGYLNSPEKVQQLKQLIEEKLILPHMNSVVSEIREYKLLYADFVYGNDKHNAMANFVDELVEDSDKYPLLNFFNITNIHSIDVIEDFYCKLQLLPEFAQTYPLTAFFLQRISDYDNIQYLYPMIKLTNYFLQHFNHRMKRDDAKTKTISDYDKDLQKIYQQFLDSWSKITLKEVSFDQKTYDFQQSQSKYHFNDKTHLSTFLLNKSNDNESLFLIACLQTLAYLQNDLVHCFYSHAKADQSYYRMIPIQSLQAKHLFDFGTNKMRKLLIEKGLMIDYTYGMSRDIIYDYEEIEWTLRNEIGCLPLIDIKNMRYFNYQFELYDENVSLINDIRVRFEQRLFDEHERTEINQFIDSLDNDAILQLSGSLEYILTYLRTVNNQNIVENSTIETFIKETMHSKISKDNQIFSTIHLKYIIDFYELIEESIFDKILRDNIRNEFREQSFPIDQRTSIINQFIHMILHDQTLADCLKDLNCWISMFKRLLMRLLSSRMNINFESPLHDYVRRSDMWKGNITEENIRTIEIKSNIRLKHGFIILKGLEANCKEGNPALQRTNAISPPPSSVQRNNRSRRRSDLRD